MFRYFVKMKKGRKEIYGEAYTKDLVLDYIKQQEQKGFKEDTIMTLIKKNKYTEKELNDMFNVFLEESGFYDYEWKYGGGKLKKDILIWKKDVEHKEILDWFDNNFENGLNDYIRKNWNIGVDEYKCDDCPKLVDCCSCPV